MGADQSSVSKERNAEKHQQMIKHALEQQRRKYEKKCEELLEEQQRMKAFLASFSDGNLPQSSTLVTQTQENHAPLYPNLNQVSTIKLIPSTSSVNYNTQSSNMLNENKSILAPFDLSPGNSIIQNKPACIETFDCKPSAPTEPTGPGTSAVSQQKHRPNTTYKKNNSGHQCPSCKMNILGINIYQCQQGHSSCNQCKVNGVNCGICRSPITNTRNIELERIVANFHQKCNVKNFERVYCPNKSDGCRLSFKPENLQYHLKECVFREMECPVAFAKYSICVWRGKINHLQAHIVECHPQQTGANVGTEMCLHHLNNNYVLHVTAVGNFTFLVHVRLDSNLQTVFMTVQLIGSLVSATKWTYEFHVYDKTDPRRKFTYIDVCLPSTIPFSEVYKEGKCAALPLQYAASFFKDSKMTYKFYIKRYETKRGSYQGSHNRETPSRSET